MKNYARIIFLMIVDLLLVNLALAVSIFTLLAASPKQFNYSGSQVILAAALIFIIYLVFFNLFKLYNRDWAYAGMGELVAIIGAVTAGSVIVVILSAFGFPLMPMYMVITQWALIIIFVGGSRLVCRLFIEHKKNVFVESGRKTIIVGAGDAGAMVARELKGHGNYSPVGFIDDDPAKKHLIILGFPVLGSREAIPRIVKRFNINLIIIAIPSVNSEAIREIIEICRSTGVEMKILPGIYQIINGNVSVSHLRLVELEDLLHREAVRVDLNEVAGYLKGENILITGAGGSIGSELCHQVSLYQPAKLILLGHGENSIHKIWLKLQEKFTGIPLALEIADVRDKAKINYVFEKHRPGVVFHAAAHKHVPLMELHPDEAVKTNVFGTLNVADAADRVGVKVFVMISTDKAVNPSSVMGATKRIAELIIQSRDKVSDTIFTAVRFGNVLGSNGSVVPIFQQQIARGGPVTVTHPEMERYFMTIPEAVQLVIQAGAMAKDGEVFILDMGEPVKIIDLAEDMIKLSGFEPGKDIKIQFTGIRPGEKLFEELLTAEEGAQATKHSRIFMAKPAAVDLSLLEVSILEHFNSGSGNIWTSEDVFNALLAVLPDIKLYQRQEVG